MNPKRPIKKVTCIEERCFTSGYDAGKYLLQLASEHRRVKINHFDITE